ncbi:MAG: TIM barrel protein [Phycisphaerales bacterium]|nr:TIM barrel protein [Phycisphaerales bacterium]
MSRRSFIAHTGAAAVAAASGVSAALAAASRIQESQAAGSATAGSAPEPSLGAGASAGSTPPPPSTGRLKHSVCRWCYGSMGLEPLCVAAKSMGITSVELLGEQDFPIVAKHGLTCAVAEGPTGIAKGLNRIEHHDAIVRRAEPMLAAASAAGIPMMIVFSGNREGLSDAEGLRNCAAGLKRVMPIAEDRGVTVVMELLNSKVDHRDYQCDRTRWGVDLVKDVGSDRFRLLYDIYHMQIMEGDVIRTINDSLWAIAHFHTGGVPGRGEIDSSQELQYPAICRAIADAGYRGWIGQEFIPRRDPMASLREAVQLCTV